MDADAEVGVKLGIALLVESKKTDKKRGPSKEARTKPCLAMKTFCPLAVY